jgi:hypothetical protein
VGSGLRMTIASMALRRVSEAGGSATQESRKPSELCCGQSVWIQVSWAFGSWSQPRDLPQEWLTLYRVTRMTGNLTKRDIY